MTDKVLGKIESVEFGLGGYQGAQLGIGFSLSGGGYGTSDFWGFWDYSIKSDKYCKWAEEDRTNYFGEIMQKISKLLKDAKVNEINKLKGKPVEIEFESNTLKSWRILTEVL